MPITTLRIPTPDGQADAFAAYPDTRESHPGVLLYTDAFGLRPEIERKARELSAHGYYVLVPHVYYRHAPVPAVDLPAHIGEDVRPAIIAELMLLVRALTAEHVVRDAGAYLDFLDARPEVSAGPNGVIGYCIGGALAMRTATCFPDRVAALAGFHPGFLVTDAPDSPHRDIHRLAAEVHLGLAVGDMSPRSLGALTEALDAAGVDHTIETYPGTIHGYTMSDTDAFSPDGLQRHWDRLLPLLRRRLTTG